MAIFFGDELKSSNKNFPIIDISENNAKGVIFVKDITNPSGTPTDDLWNATNVPFQKITQGSVLVDRITGDVYIYKGLFSNTVAGTVTPGFVSPDSTTDLDNPNDDTGASGTDYYSFFTIEGNPSWKRIGNTPVFSGDIIANIGSQGAFGKYLDGENVPLSGKTALEAIEEALTQYQVPVEGDIVFANGVMNSFSFDIAERTDAVSPYVGRFTVKNSNVVSMDSNETSGDLQDLGIKEISVSRTSDFDGGIVTVAKLSWGGPNWTTTTTNGTISSNSDGATVDYSGIQALNTYATSATTSTFYFKDDTYDIAGRDSGSFRYKVTVLGYANDIASKTSGTAQKGCFTVQSAALPSQTRSIQPRTAGVLSVSEDGNVTGTSGKRLFGNVESTVEFTVTNETPTTTINTLRIQRSFGSTYTTIKEITGLSIAHNANSTISLNDGLSGYYNGGQSVPITDRNQALIKYRIQYVDDSQSASNEGELGATTLSMYAPVRFVYYNVSGENADATSLATAVLTASEAADEVPVNINTDDNGVISSISDFIPSSNLGTSDFFYLCYPDCNQASPSPTHTSVSNPVSAQDLTNAFSLISQTAGVDVPLGVTGGAENLKYSVYISNAAGSIAPDTNISIS
jgi:hypothetical protein